ncbi:Acetyltransferase [Candidatus Trichorickettsia mobilis]|uniref:Acetyltransferase n=1 Tax=Candidatus Trichorickettsia mobilis TaxID=1346319 RepID=A0ABZ0UVL3_9RICK|nr:acetyltransferase [Candidatus Trichorickettsia mobilis]WPY01137.1 Acetyltransferase [Candidatus Trichorickettsia mobilis]
MSDIKKVVIIGDSSFAQIAFEYFNNDSPYQVVGFAVESKFRKQDSLFNIPVIDFEKIELYFPNKNHEVFVAVTYVQLNRVRTRLYLEAKNKGYKMASYVSSRAFCWGNVKLGEHVFIFEDNTLQPFVEIGNNVVLWSGNHIGHHSIIRDNCFISSHVVISGHCDIGKNCFMGVNSTISNNIIIADDCLIGIGSVITKNTEQNNIYKGNPAIATNVMATKLFKVLE